MPFGGGSGFEVVGATEYVNYMLLSSDPAGFLGLFEAWPKAGGDASFRRLRGRGAFVVSSSLVGGKVGPTTIVSERGARCTLRRPASWPKSAVTVTAVSGRPELVWQGDEFFSFETVAGTSYTLVG